MKRLFATDLDGTILPHNGKFHPSDLDALNLMGQKGIIRVVATGRSIHSALTAMDEDFPIDYLVFSSGAGVYDWRKKVIIRSLHLTRSQVVGVQSFFAERGLGYTIHQHIPNNHYFWYHHGENRHPDLLRFVQNRIDYAIPIGGLTDVEDTFCQMLTIIDKPGEIDLILNGLSDVKAIRTTSPIDGESIWIEVFHLEASKASGIDLICNIENINASNVWVLGNDFNDVDMLSKYLPQSFVVENAPVELKQIYQVVPAVGMAGMSILVNKMML
jgi:hydroxymethylpyrimidine pyrophosphatase-like HAD family hydrolase